MRVLVVCSMNKGISPFVKEQVRSLRKLGFSINIFGIKGRGKTGYLKSLFPLKEELENGCYDLVHAHYGFSGLLANLQREVPVITTYHGSDVNIKTNAKYSKLSAKLSCYNILANEKLNRILNLKEHYSVIPCGIDLEIFKPLKRECCKQKMGLLPQKNYILFSSSFDREIKNPDLARKAVERLENTELIELKGYSRKEVNLLINVSKLVLVTSHHETGPLIVKEALACNRPVVSTGVGDVKDILLDNNIEGSYLVDYSVEDVVQKCRLILDKEETYASRESIKKYKLSIIAKQISNIYSVLVAG